jgi:hypothetical protein
MRFYWAKRKIIILLCSAPEFCHICGLSLASHAGWERIAELHPVEELWQRRFAQPPLWTAQSQGGSIRALDSNLLRLAAPENLYSP